MSDLVHGSNSYTYVNSIRHQVIEVYPIWPIKSKEKRNSTKHPGHFFSNSLSLINHNKIRLWNKKKSQIDYKTACTVLSNTIFSISTRMTINNCDVKNKSLSFSYHEKITEMCHWSAIIWPKRYYIYQKLKPLHFSKFGNLNSD